VHLNKAQVNTKSELEPNEPRWKETSTVDQTPSTHQKKPISTTKDENGRKTTPPFSTFTFEYEYENESGKVGHENEHELTEFRKRTNSSRIMSNTVGIRKINTEYWHVGPSA
jgi:hypothetical protein